MHGMDTQEGLRKVYISVFLFSSLQHGFVSSSHLLCYLTQRESGNPRSFSSITMHCISCLLLVSVVWATPAQEEDYNFQAVVDACQIELKLQGAPSCEQIPIVLNYASAFVSKALGHTRRFRKYVEVFGGKGRTAKLLNSAGIPAANFDIISDPSDDFNSIIGFLWVVWLAMSIVPGGIIFFQPECASWLNQCRYHSKRDLTDTQGDTHRRDVRMANWTAAGMCFILTLAHSINVFSMIENPLASMLFPHIEDTLEMISARRVVTYGGALGWHTLKPLEIWMTIPESWDAVLETTIRRSHASARAALKTLVDLKVISAPKPLTKLVRKSASATKGWSKHGWVTGDKCTQKQSQVYPELFCGKLSQMVQTIVG